MNITLLVDNQDSWLIPFVKKIQNKLSRVHNVNFAISLDQIRKGDLAFFLACQTIVSPEILKLNKHNLVVHESDLPNGRGWSPMTWQILEGKNEITVSLFEARDRVDSGPIYLQDRIILDGHELVDELRQKQGNVTIGLVMKYVESYPKIIGRTQHGCPTYYPRRRPKDSELDVNKSIKDQFNLFRVVDNQRYPAFFRYCNHKYVLTIDKEESGNDK